MVQIDTTNPEYFNVRNKDQEIAKFAPKLEMLNKWVIDEQKEFFGKVQWLSAGAISLSVPLLINQNIITVIIFSSKNFIFTNLLALSFSWGSFILAFLFALYRNKIHPEYLHRTHMADWQKLHEEKLEIIVQALQNQNTPEHSELVEKKNQVSKIKNESLFWKNFLWKIVRGLGIASQAFLILGILLFVVFGISTLFS